MVKYILMLCSLSSVISHAQTTSTFNTDADGWTAQDNLDGPIPAYTASGGNPGGYISIADGVAGTATYFVAPSKFLGNKSGSFGATLSFDLQVDVTANSNTAGVRLEGNGLVLVKLLPQLPEVAPGWSSYTFQLDQTENWRVGSTTGPFATVQEIQEVLSSLTAVMINGEYNTSPADGGSLDNVIMTVSETSLDDIIVYNAVSPNNDGQNDFLRIENIISGTNRKNKVSIYNRWGDLVFDVEEYDNDTRIFEGKSNDNNELPLGVYFYKIEIEDRKTQTGYLSLKR